VDKIFVKEPPSDWPLVIYEAAPRTNGIIKRRVEIANITSVVSQYVFLVDLPLNRLII
jgi:hypothetical protein